MIEDYSKAMFKKDGTLSNKDDKIVNTSFEQIAQSIFSYAGKVEREYFNDEQFWLGIKYLQNNLQTNDEGVMVLNTNRIRVSKGHRPLIQIKFAP